MNKGGGGNALYRGGGSIGITGAARSVLLMAKDPDDDEKRVIAPVKNNLSKFAPSLSFRLEDYGDVGRVVWEGESPHSANTLAAAGAADAMGEASALTEAVSFLETLLSDGPVASQSVQMDAKNVGIKDATLRRAKDKLGVVSRRDGGLGASGCWINELPNNAADSTKMLMETRRCSPKMDERLGQEISAFVDDDEPEAF